MFSIFPSIMVYQSLFLLNHHHRNLTPSTGKFELLSVPPFPRFDKDSRSSSIMQTGFSLQARVQDDKFDVLKAEVRRLLFETMEIVTQAGCGKIETGRTTTTTYSIVCTIASVNQLAG